MQRSSEADELKFGALLQSNENASPLPLEHTAVSGQVIGPVADVTVSQRFGNPFKETVELIYLFPLPHEAAITDYRIKIGSRVISAEMKELEAARQAYQEAVDAGQRASLLEQRRPNLFSVQLGNVQPGETITVTLCYQERLHYEDDHYEFVFPMGVTPKYHASPAEAAKVDSPLAQTGERIGDVSLTLSVDAGVNAADPTSPSHTLQLTRQDERHFTVKLPDGVIPNKDFVLRYKVAADDVKAAVWLSADQDADTALISLLPPRLSSDAEPEPREFIFVIDRSGSMTGGPLVQALNALRACLRSMGEKDTFLIQAFDDRIEWFNEKAQTVTQANVEQADRWLNTVTARGGTEIVGAIQAALTVQPDPSRQRYVVFLTDGAVSADQQALDGIRKQRGQARIFTFGIGPSVNRSLLAKMAEYGRGTAELLQLNEDIEQAITRFQDRVSYPALLDIKLDWQGAQAWDTYPATLPDLYVGQPLELTTRLKRSESATLNISGKRKGQPITLSVALPQATEAQPTLLRLWAKARVDALLEQSYNDDKVRQQIIGLAIEHRLLTPFTAFVAVDSETVDNAQSSKRRVNVSVPLPEGLDIRGFGERVRGITLTGGAQAFPMMYAAPPAAPMAAPKPSSPGVFNRLMGKSSRSENAQSMPTPADLPDWLQSAGSPSMPEAAPTLPQIMSIAEQIKWLARTQNVSGSWGSGADEVEQTAAALIAFVRAGHTTRAGSYRRQIQKAADWLKKAKASGFAAFARWRALQELDDATQHADHYSDGASGLSLPASDAERAAMSDNSVKLPAQIASLDDLRIVALMRGEANAPPILKSSAQSLLVQTWLAVGKPLATS